MRLRCIKNYINNCFSGCGYLLCEQIKKFRYFTALIRICKHTTVAALKKIVKMNWLVSLTLVGGPPSSVSAMSLWRHEVLLAPSAVAVVLIA
jgi:hypothetical protein